MRMTNTITARNFRRLPAVEAAFSRKTLKRICEADERWFGDAYDMETHVIPDAPPGDDYYYFKDNRTNFLAVAHLDTVGHAADRTCRFVVTEGAGTVVFSRALDDRLGAYIILELLPRLGLKYDILLTVGEESGQSTAQYFDAPKQYDYMIEFDRGGTDVVMYQYEDAEVIDLVRACGAKVGNGSFSDISYLGHLGIKGFNWGVGYRDYHGPRAHAYLDDTFDMVTRYLTFAEDNEGVYMPHDDGDDDDDVWGSGWGTPSRRQSMWWEDDSMWEEYAAARDALDPDAVSLNGDPLGWNEYPSLEQIDNALDHA